MVHRQILRGLFVALCALLLSAAAQAQLFRAYVASSGSDGNPCTLAQPCRLLPAALTAVASGGEIWMLDSANYNTATVTIGKSVSILAVPGAVGSILAIGGPAVNIVASGLKVALRNLVVVPLPSGGGTDGLYMTGASRLFIENSLIANLPGNGVSVVGAGKLQIANTILRNNTGWAVYLQDGANGEISGTQMLANLGGVIIQNATATTNIASVSDSVIFGGDYGAFSYSGVAGAAVKVFVTRSTIESTSYALTSQTNNTGSAALAVSGSMIINNGYAWGIYGAGAVIRSLGNNHITDNITSSGVLTPTALR